MLNTDSIKQVAAKDQVRILAKVGSELAINAIRVIEYICKIDISLFR